MGILRFAYTLGAGVIFFIVGLPLMPVLLILEKTAPEKAMAIAFPFVRWGLRLVTAASGARLTVIGKENIPQGRSAMFVPNHRSLLDIVLMVPLLPNAACVAKDSLEHIPLLSFWMRRIRCLFLNRKDIRAGVQMVTDAADLLKQGISVMIFPEGTRSRERDKMLEFHGGSFKIAIRAGAPVVPVTIIGTDDMFENHFPKLIPGDVTIIFGEPIETDGMPIPERKLLPGKCHDIIEETYRQHKKL